MWQSETLYESGWRCTDFRELQTEFSLSPEEAKKICFELWEIEFEN